MSCWWDWEVTSFKDGEKMMVTTHRGNVSRDMELEAIRNLGRRAQVRVLSPWAVEQGDGWKQKWLDILD